MKRFRTYASINAVSMMVTIIGEAIGVMRPNVGFAISFVASFGFLAANYIALKKEK